MQHNLSFWICLVSLGYILSACQQPTNPITQPRFRLIKVTKNFPLSNTPPLETRYSYTPGGWLAATTTQPTNGTAAEVSVRFNYTYDAQHRVTKATITTNGEHDYEWYFDSLARLTTKLEYVNDPANKSLTNEVHLLYRDALVPVRVINLQGRLGMVRDSLIETYTYSGNNVVQRAMRLRTQNTNYDKATSISTYQYDTHANPYYRFLFGSYVDPDWHTFSQNNVVSADELNRYDDRGLLVEVRQRDGYYQYNYEYEAY